MFAVIFEVQPRRQQFDQYLELAKMLRPELQAIGGFIDNERFASRRTEGRILSLSTWRDEKAVIRWRTLAAHHQVQEQGRFEVFEDYHLRVGEVISDSDSPAGHLLPQQRLDETEIAPAKVLTLSELTPAAGGQAEANLAAALKLPMTGSAGVLDHEVFDSIYHPGKQVLLAAWRDVGVADDWRPVTVGSAMLRHRCVRIIRDYGMTDRREAPQYYPPVPSARSSRE